MHAKSASALAFAALLANLAVVATGCNADDTAGPAATDAPARHDGNNADPSANGADDAPKAPPVGGPVGMADLTDALGVFVAPSASAGGDGSHARPLASIQAGIDLARRTGKRVYVCSGTFREALTIADSVSIIGALDCTAAEWKTGAAHTRVDSPSTPAITATNITSGTRIQGLEVTAPDATQPSGSSIGLFASHSSGLVIADTRITSGNGMKGLDGTDGVQLANSPTANGAPASTAAACVHPTTCEFVFGDGWLRPVAAVGGTNTCGSYAHAVQPGGAGGSGGVWQPVNNVSGIDFGPYKAIPWNMSDGGVTNRTAAPGIDGTDGTNAPALGTITSDGYTPVAGTAGTDGTPGAGGGGGAGRSPEPDYDPNNASVSGVWRGFGGAGGGAGGCPGLAGSAGTGGGASIAALLIDSKVTFDSAILHTSRGGDAGRGAFGSAPTAGGYRGSNVYYPFMSGKDGGHGGAPGFSGNGSNGPAIGIAHTGAAPVVTPTTTIFVGEGGAAIPARTRNTLGVFKTIPATPAGLSKDIVGF